MKGWYRDNYRHSLASRGYRLSYKAVRGDNFIFSDIPIRNRVRHHDLDLAKNEIMEELYPETKKRALVAINADQLRIEADIQDAREALKDMQQKKEDLENLKDLEAEKEEWEEYGLEPLPSFRSPSMAGKRLALYTPTFVTADLAPIGIDAVGTAGAAAVGFIPLAVTAGVVYGGAKYGKKAYDKYKSRRYKKKRNQLFASREEDASRLEP